MNGDIQRVKKRAEALLGIEGISGVGIKKKVNPGESIRVYVEKLTPEIQEKVPSRLDGVPVEITETGKFKLLNRMGVVRPFPGGVSIGHPLVTAGTLGSRVFDSATGRRMILGNNHVLSASAGLNNLARRGDPIYQPGVFDGGGPENTIATLERWVPYSILGQNIVDCAIAVPINDNDLSDDILDIGVLSSKINMDIDDGTVVIKSGRSTGVTQAPVMDMDATIKVWITEDRFITFTDQIITDGMGSPGDSGSITMDENLRPVGLLFAGSDNLTVHNKIWNVTSRLGINFGEAIPSAPQIQFGLGLPIIIGAAALMAFMLIRNKKRAVAPIKL